MTTPYPRDMVGYGAEPPSPDPCIISRRLYVTMRAPGDRQGVESASLFQ
jgi:hypothetical protein